MITLFLTGDVMLGRGVDQILRYPVDPVIHEDYMHSALDYVRLAERASGSIPLGQRLAYVWGEAREVIDTEQPDAGIVNLETAVTDSGRAEPKGINYRMSPRNALDLGELGISCCVLANNHVLDWGRQSLAQTLDVLHRIPVATAGAGRNLDQAAEPAVIAAHNGRVLIYACATGDSGVPRHWAAGPSTAGVNRISLNDGEALAAVSSSIAAAKKPGDIVVLSVHWGTNWGYDIPEAHVKFARSVIDSAGVDLVHGHSSHHAKGWEIHRGKPILYGCGDFLNDYEGISGYEQYRGDLAPLYIASLDNMRSGALVALKIKPFRIRGYRLHRAGREDAKWLCTRLNEQGRTEGAYFHLTDDGFLVLHNPG